MAKAKKADRRVRFVSPQDAINAICSDVTSQVDRVLRSQPGVKISPSIEGASYLVESPTGSREFAFGTSACTLSSSKGKLVLRFAYRHRKPGGRTWKTRALTFEMSAETERIAWQVVESMAAVLRKGPKARR